MIPAMLVLDIIPEFRLNNIPLDTIPFSLFSTLLRERKTKLRQKDRLKQWVVYVVKQKLA